MTSNYRTWTRADLRAEGHTRVTIDRAVTAGHLIRARRDQYVAEATPDAIVRAVRVGGRSTCLSLLAVLGIFVFEVSHVHVHLVRSAGRLRSSTDRRTALQPRAVRAERLHWLPLTRPATAYDACVSVIDALLHSVACQAPRHAIATIDSALHHGWVSLTELSEAFAFLPTRYGSLLKLVDGRAESGPESLMRLIARSIGCTVELQVKIESVGRVDLLIDGWLVVECDSREFHEGWNMQKADRARDIALAARGYTSIRPTAEMIMYRPESVVAALRGLLDARVTSKA